MGGGEQGGSSRLEIADTPALATTDAAGAGTLIVQHPERGGILTRSADQTAPANKVTRFNVGGVFYSRSAPPREWRLDWMDIAGEFGGDAGAALNYLMTLVAPGDRLIFGTRRYLATTRGWLRVPMVIDGESAIWESRHAGVGLDLYPEFTERNAARVFVGDINGESATYTGVLPRVEKDTRTPWVDDGSTGVRIANAYWPRLITQRVAGFTTSLHFYADRADVAGRVMGLTYGQFQLSRLEGLTNVWLSMAPNPADNGGKDNYVTENTFMGGSFSTGTRWAAGTDFSSTTHVRIEGSKTDMLDNALFLRPSFEGSHRYGVVTTGDVSTIRVQQGRFEMPQAIYGADLSAQTRNSRIELVGIATPANAGKIRDLGRWNEIADNNFPLGRATHYEGTWTFANRKHTNGDIAGPRNWRPERLEDELAKTIIWAPGQANPVLDLSAYRRIIVNVTGQDVVIPSNFLTTINPPPAVNGVTPIYEYEVTLLQNSNAAATGSNINTLNATWFGDPTYYGTGAPAVARRNGRDIYTVQVRDGLRYVARHIRT